MAAGKLHQVHRDFGGAHRYKGQLLIFELIWSAMDICTLERHSEGTMN